MKIIINTFMLKRHRVDRIMNTYINICAWFKLDWSKNKYYTYFQNILAQIIFCEIACVVTIYLSIFVCHSVCLYGHYCTCIFMNVTQWDTDTIENEIYSTAISNTLMKSRVLKYKSNKRMFGPGRFYHIKCFITYFPQGALLSYYLT